MSRTFVTDGKQKKWEKLAADQENEWDHEEFQPCTISSSCACDANAKFNALDAVKPLEMKAFWAIRGLAGYRIQCHA